MKTPGIRKHLAHQFSIVRTIATGHVVKKFADQYHLVYFGRVNQHDDNEQLIRGMTVSQHHTDRHYCVGTVQSLDVAFVQRTDTIRHPKSPSVRHTWLIMQFDIPSVYSITPALPHVIIDAHHHSQEFFANLFLRHVRFRRVDPVHFSGHEGVFVNHCQVFCDPADNPSLARLLTPDITATIGHHFKQLDFEIEDGSLYVYASNAVVSMHVLDSMLRAGVWLSERLSSTHYEKQNRLDIL